MMESIWTSTATVPHFPPLHGDVRTDVLVIGGGIAGLLCARTLQEAGVRCIVAEAKNIAGGITKDTTAKITVQHGLIYQTLLRRFGVDRTRLYWQANRDALEAYRRLCAQIDCDWAKQDHFVYSKTDFRILEQELAALDSIGCPAELVQQVPLPFPTVGAVRFSEQAQFHPLKFLSAISNNLTIYENTPVRELAKDTAITDRGRIHADTMIVCTHFPFLNRYGSYFLKLYQQRSYAIALENALPLQGMYLDAQENGLSLRSFRDCLILGGCGHRTGMTGGGLQQLEQLAKAHYPQAKITHRWATQDCMTLDGIPYIGQYSARTPNLYVATGFNKWGMTSSMVAAHLLTDLITGKSSSYASVFSPSRGILHPQLGINAWETARNLLTPTAKRCPHMGCALKWNSQEHTWDCPCHGSRFSESGMLLDNPATSDLKQP